MKHEDVAVAPADIAAIDNAWFRGVVGFTLLHERLAEGDRIGTFAYS
jgi:hypothetical protein